MARAGRQRVAGGLERLGVGAGQEAVVEAFEPDAIPPEALLDPLVAIETALHGVREVRADLEARGAPVTIVDVEVVLIDGDRLAREVEHGRMAATLPCAR